MKGQNEAQVFGIVLAAVVALWVHFDAQKRGIKPSVAWTWSVGVFLMMILFLPLYLWQRQQPAPPGGATRPPSSPLAAPPCPYCGYPNSGDPNYCAKCGRQLKSSTEIHR